MYDGNFRKFFLMRGVKWVKSDKPNPIWPNSASADLIHPEPCHLPLVDATSIMQLCSRRNFLSVTSQKFTLDHIISLNLYKNHIKIGCTL